MNSTLASWLFKDGYFLKLSDNTKEIDFRKITDWNVNNLALVCSTKAKTFEFTLPDITMDLAQALSKCDGKITLYDVETIESGSSRVLQSKELIIKTNPSANIMRALNYYLNASDQLNIELTVTSENTLTTVELELKMAPDSKRLCLISYRYYLIQIANVLNLKLNEQLTT